MVDAVEQSLDAETGCCLWQIASTMAGATKARTREALDIAAGDPLRRLEQGRVDRPRRFRAAIDYNPGLDAGAASSQLARSG